MKFGQVDKFVANIGAGFLPKPNHNIMGMNYIPWGWIFTIQYLGQDYIVRALCWILPRPNHNIMGLNYILQLGWMFTIQYLGQDYILSEHWAGFVHRLIHKIILWINGKCLKLKLYVITGRYGWVSLAVGTHLWLDIWCKWLKLKLYIIMGRYGCVLLAMGTHLWWLVKLF